MIKDELQRNVSQRIERIEARARARFAKGGITWEHALQIESAAENEAEFANRELGKSIYILRGSSRGPMEV